MFSLSLSFVRLLFYERVKPCTVAFVYYKRVHLLPSARELVYSRNRYASVCGKGHGTRYRSRAHHKTVYVFRFLEQCRALSYTETMLLVDNRKSETVNFYLLRYKSLRSDNNVNPVKLVFVRKSGENHISCFLPR